ncbi:MAG: response regulator [Planctomycetota bacterium]
MTDDPAHPTILLVDDNELLRERLAEAFVERGFRTLTAGCVEDAIPLVDRGGIDRAVIDLRMPGASGIELVRHLTENSPDTKAIVMTGFGSIANAVDAVHAGAVNYVTKPADVEEILAAFDRERPDPEGQDGYQPPTLAEAEWEHIQKVLADCENNISKAARVLGIERRTLQRKLKKMRP